MTFAIVCGSLRQCSRHELSEKLKEINKQSQAKDGFYFAL